MVDAVFYKGYANDYTVSLFNSGLSVPITAVDRVVFKNQIAEIDSDVNPELFSFETDAIVLKFGKLTITAGTYEFAMIVYSIDYPDGIVWDDSVIIRLEQI